MSRLNPGEIERSIAAIEVVYRYAIGEQALPIQDPELAKRFTSSIAGYFDYTSKALTTPAVIDLFLRSRVGLVGWNGEELYVVKYSPNIRMVAKEPSQYSRSNVVCLEAGPVPRLIYCVQEHLSKPDDIDNPELEAKKVAWQQRMKDQYTPKDGKDDWIFGEIQTGDIRLWGSRSMGSADLLSNELLPTFVYGVGRTFTYLKDFALDEVAASQFNGANHVEEITAIAQAFENANQILGKVLGPK